MHTWMLPGGFDIKPLDDVMLRSDGSLNVVPSRKLNEFPVELLQLWCVKRGVYQYPTEELLEWLSQQTAGRRAIEICAGNGAIGRALGIVTTDSYMQTTPEIADYYNSLGQTPIMPPPDVLKLDANEAVERYEPDVVIGAWVTELWQPGDRMGSVWGVDELAILNRVATYIHIGNDGTHAYKRAMRKTHQLSRFGWLVSRAKNPPLNHIGVWSLADPFTSAASSPPPAAGTTPGAAGGARHPGNYSSGAPAPN